MSQVNPLGLRDKAKYFPVTIEAPGPTSLRDFEGGLAVPV
jgi:hypothetical protein